MEDNRIEAMIDADTKIIFRKDFGENAHPLPVKQGFPAGVDINHYNIEIQVRKHPGTEIDSWKWIRKYHIVIDAISGNVTHFF